jgi:hypothetical protein
MDSDNLFWGWAAIIAGIATFMLVVNQGCKGVFYVEDPNQPIAAESVPVTKESQPILFWFSFFIGLAVAVGFLVVGMLFLFE